MFPYLFFFLVDLKAQFPEGVGLDKPLSIFLLIARGQITEIINKTSLKIASVLTLEPR
jgi:hypothetical protein